MSNTVDRRIGIGVTQKSRHITACFCGRFVNFSSDPDRLKCRSCKGRALYIRSAVNALAHGSSPNPLDVSWLEKHCFITGNELQSQLQEQAAEYKRWRGLQ